MAALRSSLILLVSLSFVLTSCSLIQGKKRRRSRRPVIAQDVPAFKGIRKRLLVLPFIDKSGQRPQKVLDKARRSVVQELVRSNLFIVVQNNDYPGDLNRHLKNREYDLETISKTAQGLGIAGIVEGKILNINARMVGDKVGFFKKLRARVDGSVQIRVYAAKNSREILNDVRSAQNETSTTHFGRRKISPKELEEDPVLVQQVIQKAFAGTIGHIVRALDKLDWEGRVALVKGDRIYLNAGQLSGIQVGDILKVMEEGEEVYDPETGVLIGRVPGRMKGTIEIVSYCGRDGAIAIVHSGSGFVENDRVEIY